MRRRRNLWGLTAGTAVIVAVGMLVGVRVWAAGPVMPPDPAQVRAVMPAITAYLQSPAYRDRNGAYPAAAYRTGRVRWLCAVEIVYVGPEGTRWRAGMDVACGDYERQGSRVILADGGDMSHEVMVLSGNGRFPGSEAGGSTAGRDPEGRTPASPDAGPGIAATLGCRSSDGSWASTARRASRRSTRERRRRRR